MVVLKSYLRFKNFDFLENIFIEHFLSPAVLLISSNLPGNNSNGISSWTNIPNVDSVVNSMKAQCLHFLEAFVKYHKLIIDQKVVSILSGIVESLLKDVEFILKEKYNFLSNFERDTVKFPNFSYEQITIRMINFLAIFLTREPIIMHFYKFSKNLVVNLVLPLMVSTASEKEEMIDEPEKYDGFVTDLLTKNVK